MDKREQIINRLYFLELLIRNPQYEEEKNKYEEEYDKLEKYLENLED